LPQYPLAVPGMQTPAAQQPVAQVAALHLPLPEDIRASVPPSFCFAGAE